MVRVLADKQPTPLPMTIPQEPINTGILQGTGGVIADDAINDLLNSILSDPGTN